MSPQIDEKLTLDLQRTPWRSKGRQELAKASHGVKNDPKSSSQQPKHVENGHQAPVTSTGYRSRVGRRQGAKPLRYIYTYKYIYIYILYT